MELQNFNSLFSMIINNMKAVKDKTNSLHNPIGKFLLSIPSS